MAKKVKFYPPPPIVWLKVTDYMHGWMQHELGGEARVGGLRVVSVQHLPGARDILKMEVVEDMMELKPCGNVLSDTRKNLYDNGLIIDADVMARDFGVTKELMQMMLPIECPKMCLTKHGVLRPWTNNICMGKEQAKLMSRLLREAFWAGVEEFDYYYAKKAGDHYPAREMVEAFCEETETPDFYVDAIRREWQRRSKM